MQAWLKYAEWRDWCWNGGDFDSDYFDQDNTVEVIELSEGQPFGGETLYKIRQLNQGNEVIAFIPMRFLSLTFEDNMMDYRSIEMLAKD